MHFQKLMIVLGPPASETLLLTATHQKQDSIRM